MKLPSTLRRPATRVAAIAASTAALLVTALTGPANATPVAGWPADMDLLGPGSAYTMAHGNYVSLTVAPTATATFKIKVYNRKSVAETGIELGLNNYVGEANVTVQAGLKKLVPSGSTYTLPKIGARGALVLTVKVDPTNYTGNNPAGAAYIAANLYVDNVGYDYGYLMAFETRSDSASHGSVSAKAGNALWTGGGALTNGQVATAPAINTLGTATYTLRIRNNTSDYATVYPWVEISANPDCWTYDFRVKSGYSSYSITSSLLAGQEFRILGPGEVSDITVVVKRAQKGCGMTTARFGAGSDWGVHDGEYQYIHTNPVAGT